MDRTTQGGRKRFSDNAFSSQSVGLHFISSRAHLEVCAGSSQVTEVEIGGSAITEGVEELTSRFLTTASAG